MGKPQGQVAFRTAGIGHRQARQIATEIHVELRAGDLTGRQDVARAGGGGIDILEVGAQGQLFVDRPLGTQRVIGGHRMPLGQAGIGFGRHILERAVDELVAVIDLDARQALHRVGAGQREERIIVPAEVVVRTQHLRIDLHCIVRTPLHRKRAGLALALADGGVDAGAVRYRHALAFVARQIGLGVPRLDRDGVLTERALLLRVVHQDADLADTGLPAIAEQARERRLAVVGEVVIVVLHAAGDLAAVVVERQTRAQVDRAAQATFDHVGRRILVDIDATEQFGRHVFEAQATAVVGGKDVATIELGAHLGEAADGDRAAFAVVARNLDSGDALQRFGHVVVGQLADVFGNDGIDDLLCVLLDQLRLGHAAAGTGDLHGVQLLRRRIRCRRGSGGRILRIGLRAQQRGHTDGHHGAAEITDRTLTHSPACRNVAMLH